MAEQKNTYHETPPTAREFPWHERPYASLVNTEAVTAMLTEFDEAEQPRALELIENCFEAAFLEYFFTHPADKLNDVFFKANEQGQMPTLEEVTAQFPQFAEDFKPLLAKALVDIHQAMQNPPISESSL